MADAPIVPTELQSSGKVLRGEVHDPLARVANRGISGNAGLFSTAEDLAVMASVLMNGGKISLPDEGFIATLGSKEPVRIF
jgi:CubicO group peptidase (beta-lactamase class C family)